MSKATIGKLAILAGAPLLSGLAFAAPPSFGEWDVSDGEIDACGTARTNIMSCQVLVKDKGFVQVQVKDSDGKSYVQSILTDFNATGTPGHMSDGTTPATDLLTFYDENYIRINFQAQASSIADFTYGDPGFMGVQVINDAGDSSSATWFEATTKIATGWGINIMYEEHGSTDPATASVATVVELTTDFWTTGVWNPATGTTDSANGEYNGMFDTSFYYKGLNGVAGDLLGRDLYIDQDLSLATANPVGVSDSNDRQTFYFWDRSGELLDPGVAGVWGSTTDDVADVDDPFTGIASQQSVDWGTGNTLPVSSDPGIAGPQVIAFFIAQEVSTLGFGDDGKSTFYHLQVDGTGAYDDQMAYSQAGTGFEDVYITEIDPTTGTVQFAMGGMEDWLVADAFNPDDSINNPEKAFFPPPAYLQDVADTIGTTPTGPIVPPVLPPATPIP